MGTAYIYPPTKARYCKRHRSLERHTLDGMVATLTTRYTYGTFKRPCKGPRGGRAYRECRRAVYYADGTFWRASKCQDDNGRWHNVIEPFTGRMWDAHPTQSESQGVPVVTIECADGRPVAVRDNGETIWTPQDAMPWVIVEATLSLD